MKGKVWVGMIAALVGFYLSAGVWAASNYVSTGDTFKWTNGTGNDVSAGDVVDVGDIYGVAVGDIANAADGTVRLKGIFDLTLQTNETIAIGDKLYWDSSNEVVTETATADTFIGTAMEAQTTTTSTTLLKVRMNSFIRDNVGGSFATDLLPATDGTYDLGSAALEWEDLRVDGFAHIDALTNSAAMQCHVDFVPGSDGTYDLGASGTEWQDLYIDGTANIDALVADTADINAGTVDATIGGTTPAAGAFTTLSASSTFTVGQTNAAGSEALAAITTAPNVINAQTNAPIWCNITIGGEIFVFAVYQLDD